MDAQLLKLISISFRIFVVSAPNIALIVYVYSLILKRKRSLLWAVALFSVKILVHSILVQIILEYYYGSTQWWGVLNAVFIWILAIMAFALWCWIFDADFLKIAVVAVVGEVIGGIVVFPCIALINLLEGRTDTWAYEVEFQLLDLLIPVLEFLIIRIICRLMTSWFEKIRDCRIVHRKLMWTLFVIYVCGASLCLFQSMQTLEEHNPFLVFWSLGMVIVISALIYRYSEGLKREQVFLSARQRLGQTYYETIQRQIRQMEQSQQVIDQQMEQIIQMKELDSETAASYLEQIKSAHEEIRAGIYCDDWVIDALLYSQEMLLRKKGIRLQCSLQGYTRGQISEADMIQILTVLLEYGEDILSGVCGVSEEKTLLLEVTTIKKQMIMEMSLAGREKNRSLKKKLRSYLKKYDGTLVNLQEGEKVKVVLALKAGI